MTHSTVFFKLGAFCARILPPKLQNFVALHLLSSIQARGVARKEIQSGVVLNLDLSDWFQRLYYLGLVEQQTFKILKSLVPCGGTFVDVGAYIGLFSCIMAHHVGPNGSVIAFEPMSACFTQLRANISLNRLGNIQIQPIALSNSAGRLPLYLPQYYGGTSAIAQVWNPSDWKPFETVSSATLDQVFDGKSLDCIKIDVQGHEQEVLEGAVRLIERFHPVVLCELVGPHRNKNMKLLQNWGYEVFVNSNGRLSASLPGPMDGADFFFIHRKFQQEQLS